MEEGSQSDNRSISISIKPAQAPGTGNGTASSSSWTTACRHGREGEAMSLGCLSGLLCLPVRFVARSFSPSTPLPPPPPGTCRGGVAGQRERERKKGKPQQQKGPLPLPTDPDHHPVGAPESKRPGQQGHCGGGTEGDRRGSGLGRAPEKGTWRKRRSEYVLTHPSSPTQSNPGRASFLPFHIHIPCRTGTGSGTGTTLDRE